MKYTYYSQLQTVYAKGHSLVIYQYSGCNGSVAEQIERHISELSSILSVSKTRIAVVKGNSRFYLIVKQAAHTATLDENLETIKEIDKRILQAL